MDLLLISLISVLVLILLFLLFSISKRQSKESTENFQSLKSLTEALTNQYQNQVTELLNQQKDLLNRLQSHNWTEYSQLAASVLPAFQGPPERINPDDLYNQEFDEAMDHWGNFEPPAKFEDAEAAIRGLMGNVPT